MEHGAVIAETWQRSCWVLNSSDPLAEFGGPFSPLQKRRWWSAPTCCRQFVPRGNRMTSKMSFFGTETFGSLTQIRSNGRLQCPSRKRVAIVFEMIDRTIGRSARLLTVLACSQRLRRWPFARLSSTVDFLRSNDKEHASSIAVNCLPLDQPEANEELWDFLRWPPPQIRRVSSNRRHQIDRILRVKTLMFMWWQSGILYIASDGRKNHQKGRYMSSTTNKMLPRKGLSWN
jgi:hypothetical protein